MIGLEFRRKAANRKMQALARSEALTIEPLAKFIEGVIFEDSTRVAVVAGQVGAGRKAVTRNI
jgi:hypothetical protein